MEGAVGNAKGDAGIGVVELLDNAEIVRVHLVAGLGFFVRVFLGLAHKTVSNSLNELLSVGSGAILDLVVRRHSCDWRGGGCRKAGRYSRWVVEKWDIRCRSKETLSNDENVNCKVTKAVVGQREKRKKRGKPRLRP